MDERAAIQHRCEAAAKAIATQPRDTWAYWTRQLLEALDAEAGDSYEATLVEIHAEIDARLIVGMW